MTSTLRTFWESRSAEHGGASAGRRSYGLWRAFWSAGALAHLPAICDLSLAGLLSGAHIGRALMLVAGLVFCVLKALDWSALRVRPGAQSRVICVLAMGLLHIGLIPHLDDDTVDLCLTTTTSTTLLVALSYCAAEVLGTVARHRAPRRHPETQGFSDLSAEGLFELLAQRVRLPVAGPRSPPLCA